MNLGYLPFLVPFRGWWLSRNCKLTLAIVLFSLVHIFVTFVKYCSSLICNVLSDDLKKPDNGESLFFMRKSIVPPDLGEVLRASEIVDSCNTQVRQPSYHPTSWPMINRILDVVDDLTGGLAGWVQRFFSFAFIGGFASCVNLIVFYIVDHFVNLPVSAVAHNAIAFVAANEIALLANFIPNDYFTFRRLAGNRPWGLRCARFHVTACSGITLTYILQFCFNFFFHLPSIFALATAIWIVLFYNFTFHHVFTYRHKKPAVSNASSSGSEVELIKQTLVEQINLGVEAADLTPVEATSSR
jgi:putative flippase GtrA